MEGTDTQRSISIIHSNNNTNTQPHHTMLTSMWVLWTKLWVNILLLYVSKGPVTPKLGISVLLCKALIRSFAQLGVTIMVSSLTYNNNSKHYTILSSQWCLLDRSNQTHPSTRSTPAATPLAREHRANLQSALA